MSGADKAPQSVTSQWVQRLRREVLVNGNRDLAKLACIGMWMATFANADGTSITAGRDTIATLAGVSPETVSRALKTFKGVGMMRGKRRPNKSAEHVLTIPVGSGELDWKTWLPEFTESRQRLAYRRKKDADMAEVLASRSAGTASTDANPDGVDGRQPDRPDSVRGCVPDSVRGGCSEPFGEHPDSVDGRYWTASTDAIRIASVAGGTMSHLPPVVTSTSDLDTPQLSPQPQVGALLGSAKIDQPDGGWGTTSCPRCGARVVSRPGRSVCVACLREEQ